MKEAILGKVIGSLMENTISIDEGYYWTSGLHVGSGIWIIERELFQDDAMFPNTVVIINLENKNILSVKKYFSDKEDF